MANNLIPSELRTKHSLRHKVKQKMSLLKRFLKSFDDFDTTYVAPNLYNYTVMLQNTNYHQLYRFDEGSRIISSSGEERERQVLSMGPRPSMRVGPYLGWRWIFVGYTFDVSKPAKAGSMSEFSLSLYSALLGCDFVWVRNKGNFELRRTAGFDGVGQKQYKGTDFGGMNAEVLSFNAYYVFDHKKFSYPAAYNQSTMQRRSRGSWIAGFQFTRQKMEFDPSRLPEVLDAGLVDALRFKNITYNSYSLCGGYAYNWVVARNLLLGISVTPALGYKHAKGDRSVAESWSSSFRYFSVDCLSRAGIVWNNSRAFVGASFINHLYSYRNKQLSLYNAVYYLNLYAGVYFGAKHRSKTPKSR